MARDTSTGALGHRALRLAEAVDPLRRWGSLIGTFIVWKFIFAVPALFSLACAACLAIAYVLSRSEEPSSKTTRTSTICLSTPEGDRERTPCRAMRADP